MFCKDYKFQKWTTVDDVVKPIVWVELYADTVPSPLPTNAVGIENFPECYEKANVIFSPGSTLMVVNTGAVYIANASSTFMLQ